MSNKNYRTVQSDGHLCPRCKQEAEAREHLVIRNKELQQNYYYTRWYHCKNMSCPTKTFFDDMWKVENKNAQRKRKGKKPMSYQEWKEYGEQMDFIKSI